ncbi:hotdog fold thioesterase, partial [Escherichia coli]
LLTRRQRQMCIRDRHGGASAALAETLGSMAGFMMTRDGQCVVGTELNATHHRPVSEGKVRGVCQPLHL